MYLVKAEQLTQITSFFGPDRLGKVKVKDCPAQLRNWPRRVRAPSRARDRRKATVKI